MAAARHQRNFLLSITHELKSPLAGIQLALQTMKKRVLKEDMRERLTDSALSETSRLTSLVEDLLLSAKLDTQYTPEPGAVGPPATGHRVGGANADQVPGDLVWTRRRRRGIQCVSRRLRDLLGARQPPRECRQVHRRPDLASRWPSASAAATSTWRSATMGLGSATRRRSGSSTNSTASAMKTLVQQKAPGWAYTS